MDDYNRKIVYLMRGLPGSGKSHRAKRLAGEKGIVLETDAYFVSDGVFRYDESRLTAARAWNLERLSQAITAGTTPIVVDRGNGLNAETREFALLAVSGGYAAMLAEPDSPWWQELRILLKNRANVQSELLDDWACRLSARTKSSRCVPAETIRRWMNGWKHDLTVEQILKVD